MGVIAAVLRVFGDAVDRGLDLLESRGRIMVWAVPGHGREVVASVAQLFTRVAIAAAGQQKAKEYDDGGGIDGDPHERTLAASLAWSRWTASHRRIGLTPRRMPARGVVSFRNAMTRACVRLAEEVNMGRSILLAVLLLTTTLSGCGTQTVVRNAPSPFLSVDDGPVVKADGEVMVSCGDGEGWVPSVMSKGVPSVLSEDEARRMFEGILRDPRTGEEAALSLFPGGVDVDWRVLRQDEKSLTLGLGRWTEQGPAGEGSRTLRLEAEGNSWRAAGWGDCHLSPVLKAHHTRVEVTGYQGDAESRRLTTRIHERECTSGRDPSRFLHKPLVVETDDSVTIYWTSEPPQGGDCRGNPSIDRVVELEQPLGARTVFDGLTYPPRQVPPR